MTSKNHIAPALAALALACGGPEAATPEPGTTGEPAATVSATEASPAIKSIALLPDPPRPGQALRADVRLADHGESRPRLVYSWLVRGRPVPSDGASIVLPSLRKGDTVQVTVVATDGTRRSEPTSAEVTVANRPPRIVDLSMRRETRKGTEHWVVNPQASDPDGDAVSFEYVWLRNGNRTEASGPAMATDDLRRGDRVRVRVVASDGEDESAAAESDVVEIANTPPDIVSRPTGLDESGEFNYAIRAEDSDGDRLLRFTLVEGPEGMTLDASTGTLAWAPRIDQAGQHRVEVLVDDRNGGESRQVFVLPVVVREAEAPPAAPQG